MPESIADVESPKTPEAGSSSPVVSAKPTPEKPSTAPEPILPQTPDALATVPQVTAHPEWRLSQEDWSTYKTSVETLKSTIASVLELGGILTPLVDALRDVADEEVAPTIKKRWDKRKLWG